MISNPASTTDIRALVYLIPSGIYINVAPALNNVTFPIAVGSGLLVNWLRVQYSANGLYYGILTIRSLTGENNKTYTCSIYNNSSYSAWSETG